MTPAALAARLRAWRDRTFHAAPDHESSGAARFEASCRVAVVSDADGLDGVLVQCLYDGGDDLRSSTDDQNRHGRPFVRDPVGRTLM